VTALTVQPIDADGDSYVEFTRIHGAYPMVGVASAYAAEPVALEPALEPRAWFVAPRPSISIGCLTTPSGASDSAFD
jgi:hypothetical protein